MDKNKAFAHETIRMLFELDRDDNPWLYDDLIRFKKGTKRINRLRFLAHEGVVSQSSSAIAGAAPRSTTARAGAGLVEALPATSPFDAPAAADVFGAPVTER